MKKKKLTVGFAGARWLGVECLKILDKRRDVEIKYVCMPKVSEPVWWKDVVDEKEVKKLGYKITPWEKWTDLKVDIIFSVLHGGIFRKSHLENARFGIINLHPAPLPEYRGCNSYTHAIINGDKEYRVSLHYVNEGVDTGPLIAAGKLSINDEDTGNSLYNSAQPVALAVFGKMLPKIIEAAKNGRRYKSIKQDDKKARYYKRDSLSNKEIDLSWNRNKLYDFVRALDFPPFEPAFVKVGEHRIYLVTKNRLENL